MGKRSNRGEGPPQAVVLVHGLWTGRWVMALQGRRLARCGFRPAFFAYDSMGGSLTEAAAALARFAAALAAPVHLVGHSLGGLVILRMLERAPAQAVGRVLLLGSPYAASAVAERLGGTGWGRWLLGPALGEWRQRQPAPLAGRELGVLAGCRSLGMGRLVTNIEGPNDGVVAAAETRIPGMEDFILLRVAHTEMLWSGEVARQACLFLKRGRFDHREPAEPPCPPASA